MAGHYQHYEGDDARDFHEHSLIEGELLSAADLAEELGIEAVPDADEKLAAIGVTSIRRGDVLSLAEPAIILFQTKGSIIDTILNERFAATGDEEDYGRTMQKIIVDTLRGQFEANWPEYL